MKVAIMQPYFVPYIGYWQLMNAVDKYVVLDDVNFIKRGWINRNRILVNGRPQYFNVPLLAASQNKRIKDIKVNRDPRYRKKNLKTIEHAYRRAPYYEGVYPLVEQILTCAKDNISAFIVESFKVLCRYLDISTEFILSSAIKKDDGLRGKDKILDICQRLDATEYYNAIGGKKLYSYEDFQKAGIPLSFLETDSISYRQFNDPFQSNLSIIDVMMFNSRDQIKEMLKQYRLLRG